MAKSNKIRMPKQVLFVCIFNIKRSVAAEHFLRKKLTDTSSECLKEIQVSSAGFLGKEVSEWFKANSIPFPDPLFDRTTSDQIKAVLLERGINISDHRSRPVNRKMLNSCHMIVPLLKVLKRDLVYAYPDVKDKIVLPEELLAEERRFYWEDTHLVPKDSRMYDFAHGNKDYVVTVVDEIEDFILQAFDKILSRVLRES